MCIRDRDLGAELSGKLRLVIVPIKYDTDGSGRTPTVSTAQLDLYKKTMMRVYPASEVEVTTHAPYPWTTQIAGNGTGFSSVLRAMTQLRQRDQADHDVYYYGLLAPTSSMNTFCQGSCVTGLSTVVEDADTAVMRASVGIGFPGQDSANTMAHEVGHAHGREHAPCGGAASTDPSFPYSGGGIGVWGYDIFAKTFLAPTKGKDMMGYCPNEWVSDYTYNALFERITTISTEKKVQSAMPGAVASTAPVAARYRVATVKMCIRDRVRAPPQPVPRESSTSSEATTPPMRATSFMRPIRSTAHTAAGRAPSTRSPENCAISGGHRAVQ